MKIKPHPRLKIPATGYTFLCPIIHTPGVFTAMNFQYLKLNSLGAVSIPVKEVLK
jgi:hypothetical protein